MRIGISLAAFSAAVLIAACSGTPSPGSHKAAATPSAQPAVASSPPSCQSQFLAWHNGGGSADFSAFRSALKANQKALAASMAAAESPASLAAVSSAAAALQAAAQTMQADPAPACIPNLQSDLGTALAAYASAAQGEINMDQAAQSGNISTANSDAQAVATNINSGNTALAAATSDISAFSGS